MSRVLRQLIKEKAIPAPQPSRANLFDLLVNRPDNGVLMKVCQPKWARQHPQRHVLVRGVQFQKDMRRGTVWGQLMSGDKIIGRPQPVRQALHPWKIWREPAEQVSSSPHVH